MRNKDTSGVFLIGLEHQENFLLLSFGKRGGESFGSVYVKNIFNVFS